MAIVILPFWFICKKAGFSPWLALLNIIPFGNLILIYVLAFAEWKVVPVPQALLSAAAAISAAASSTAVLEWRLRSSCKNRWNATADSSLTTPELKDVRGPVHSE